MDPGARPSVGARLRRARLRRGMSGRELAAAIGVSPATLSQLENDKAQLTVARLESIATALGVSACDILAQRGADPVTGIDTGTTRSGTPTAASPTAASPTAASPTSGKSASDWRRYGPLRSDPVLAAALADWTAAAAAREGLSTVALGGGCLLNHVLAQALVAQLVARGLLVLEARQAPPNDGGLSLGQAWVARRLLSLDHD